MISISISRFSSEAQTTPEEMVEKTSSRGKTQIFVTSVARFHDDAGQLLAINRETQVLQPIEV